MSNTTAKLPLLATVAVLLLPFCAIATPGNATLANSTLAFACNSCHQPQQLALLAQTPVASRVSALSGEPSNQLEVALLDFKYGRRRAYIMGRISRGFGDAQIKSIAQYYLQIQP